MRLFSAAALAGSVLLALPVFAADAGSSSDKFGKEFAKHWAAAKELTLAVAAAMPDENYGFKPNPEEMSFGEQLLHIAQSDYSACARLTGEKSPFAKPATVDKASVTQVLTGSFDYCAEAVGKVKDFDTMVGAEGHQVSVREGLLGMWTHMAHHRGQAEVYLRVKNIKPPAYKF